MRADADFFHLPPEEQRADVSNITYYCPSVCFPFLARAPTGGHVMIFTQTKYLPILGTFKCCNC